ncbi:MAG: hypothetical protein ABR568_21180 [Pyrinomonadaceae bacterium]
MLPAKRADHDALPDALSVRQEFLPRKWHGRAGHIAVGGLVHPVDEVARLLKFNREEELPKR